MTSLNPRWLYHSAPLQTARGSGRCPTHIPGATVPPLWLVNPQGRTRTCCTCGEPHTAPVLPGCRAAGTVSHWPPGFTCSKAGISGVTPEWLWVRRATSPSKPLESLGEQGCWELACSERLKEEQTLVLQKRGDPRVTSAALRE